MRGRWKPRLVDALPDKRRRREHRARPARMIGEATGMRRSRMIRHIINAAHVPNTGRINASNPCSEYMHLETAPVNLASSIHAVPAADGTFDVQSSTCGRHHDHRAGHPGRRSSYPTSEIRGQRACLSRARLGYANWARFLSPRPSLRLRSRREYAGRRDAGHVRRRIGSLPRCTRSSLRRLRANRDLSWGDRRHRARAQLDARWSRSISSPCATCGCGARGGGREGCGLRSRCRPDRDIAFMMDCDTRRRAEIALVSKRRSSAVAC